MEGIPKDRKKGEPRLEKVSVNSAGYPSYKVSREDVELDTFVKSKEGGWLNEKQKDSLRAYLLALGVAVVPAKWIDSQMTDRESDSYVVAENTVDHSNESNEVQEKISANFVLPDNQKDSSDLSEKLEDETVDAEELLQTAFSTEILKRSEEINDVDFTWMKMYADKPVVGAKGYTRERYVEEKIEFTEWDEIEHTGVHPAAQTELKKLISGLCAKESAFRADLESSAGAKGVFQIMSYNWENHGGEPGKEQSLKESTKVAGKLMSSIYNQVKVHLGEERLSKLRTYFSDEASFEKDFMVPVTLNSYQTGAGRMTTAVELYLDSMSGKSLPEAKDLYLAIADFAENSKDGKLKSYGPHSRGYVPKIYAFNKALSDEKEVNIKLASR